MQSELQGLGVNFIANIQKGDGPLVVEELSVSALRDESDEAFRYTWWESPGEHCILYHAAEVLSDERPEAGEKVHRYTIGARSLVFCQFTGRPVEFLFGKRFAELQGC